MPAATRYVKPADRVDAALRAAPVRLDDSLLTKMI